MDLGGTIAIDTSNTNDETSVKFDGLIVSAGRANVQVEATSTTSGCTNKDTDVDTAVSLSNTASSITVTGLTSGCPYSFTLKAACEESDGSTVVTSAASHSADYCTTPQAIQSTVFTQTEDSLTSVTLTSVTITSGSFVDILATATERCSSADTDTTTVSSTSVTTTPHSFNNLASGCLFTFSFTPRCTADNGASYVSGPTKTETICTS